MDDKQFKTLSALICTLITILVEKGIMTNEEFDINLVKSNQRLDQLFQEVKEEERKKLEKEYPDICNSPFGKILFPGVFDDDLGVKL